MTLREQIMQWLRKEWGDHVPADRVDDAMAVAKLSLESLPCQCDSPELEPKYRRHTCARCQRLVSLSEGGR